jgi:hypothetical protein
VATTYDDRVVVVGCHEFFLHRKHLEGATRMKRSRTPFALAGQHFQVLLNEEYR